MAEAVRPANGRHTVNGIARAATSEAAARTGVDVEVSEEDFNESDSEDRSSVEDDESDEASKEDDVKAAERRRSGAAAAASGRPATGVLLCTAGGCVHSAAC